MNCGAAARRMADAPRNNGALPTQPDGSDLTATAASQT